MIVISDTSPITNLFQIDKLEILKEIFSEVIVPQEVYKELVELDSQKEFLASIEWVVVKEVYDKELVGKLVKDIDKGEAESIALAIELEADVLLIDEKKGRKIAKERLKNKFVNFG